MDHQSQLYSKWQQRKPERYDYSHQNAPPCIALLGPSAWPATVHDISATGVGLILSLQLPPRVKMRIELRSRADGEWHARTARVVHCSRRDLHTWRVGFDFTQPFTDTELQDLLP